ncbi:Transcription initiation factor IIF subunit alpha [Mycena sanguinolenta]|uniref:Transcription initiation factor IIF subunit alpha n=1 Tax=Mycena sanguinolenta TaxID=230812 RepID=A0A8H7D1I9_9AGAR|nr:Transcription initiation factor IIF subunit alpha [Mycena sanguinolenta]
MAPKPSSAQLFHPKKGPKKDTQQAPSPKRPSGAPPRPKPAVNEEDEEELKLPDTPFQEFKVMSSALNGWKYDVMKFDSRKPVDLTAWRGPIKLNRKEMRRDDASGSQVAVGPMLGLDGKPVVGPDGKFVMVDAEGRPIQPVDPKGKGPAVVANGKKKFQKKTRQVYVVPEEVRQLRREERYPWVMEDATGAETWLGQLEDISKAGTHAFFMPAANDIFKFVPAHRWYKFQKKLKHDFPTDTATVESAYTKSQKRDPQQWLLNRNGKGPSDETAAMFKAESEGRALAGTSSLVHASSQSLGPNGRKLKTVDSGMSGLFGDDDEDGGAKRRREKEYGEEGDLDEMVYEADFADDEEKVDLEAEDEETKDIEERLKKEYKTANKQREGHVDESDDEEMPGMTKQGKKMQKIIRTREGNDAYGSDDEKDPYASSAEEEEEEPPVELVVLQPPVPPQPPADSASTPQTPGTQTPPPAARPPAGGGSKAGSRATSPALSPSLGGHSVVAKRATSPKVPKQKTNGASRANSPLGSRATSPVANSRATSPAANGGTPVTNGMQKKRKATDDYAPGSPSPTSPNGQSAPPKAKKRKSNAIVPVGELEDRMVIEWLKNNTATTRDCIQYFQPYLTNDATKSKFTALIKEVAQLKNGVVVLREAYGGTS